MKKPVISGLTVAGATLLAIICHIGRFWLWPLLLLDFLLIVYCRAMRHEPGYNVFSLCALSVTAGLTSAIYLSSWGVV